MKIKGRYIGSHREPGVIVITMAVDEGEILKYNDAIAKRCALVEHPVTLELFACTHKDPCEV